MKSLIVPVSFLCLAFAVAPGGARNHFLGGTNDGHPDKIAQVFGKGSNNHFVGGTHQLAKRNAQEFQEQFLRPFVENFPGGWNPADGNPANPRNFHDAITRRFQEARANPDNNVEFHDHQGGNVRGQNRQGGFHSHNHGKRSVDVFEQEVDPSQQLKWHNYRHNRPRNYNGGTHHHHYYNQGPHGGWRGYW